MLLYITVDQKILGLLCLWRLAQPVCNRQQTPTPKHKFPHNPQVVDVHRRFAATTTKEK